MHPLFRAVARLLVMGFVMTAVLVAAVFAGVGATTAVALGIVLAGIVGLIGVGRRPRPGAPIEQVAAMEATLAAAAATQRTEETTAVDAMAPPLAAPGIVDPEANMPRWRRPSLLEARRADPTRGWAASRPAMRFADERTNSPDVRIVRYAVVPVLDRPDEIMGIRLADLASGDEVVSVGASGAFVEVDCPTGEHGWIHRTTIGPKTSAFQNPLRSAQSDPDDALTAVLSARGLI